MSFCFVEHLAVVAILLELRQLLVDEPLDASAARSASASTSRRRPSAPSTGRSPATRRCSDFVRPRRRRWRPPPPPPPPPRPWRRPAAFSARPASSSAGRRAAPKSQSQMATMFWLITCCGVAAAHAVDADGRDVERCRSAPGSRGPSTCRGTIVNAAPVAAAVWTNLRASDRRGTLMRNSCARMVTPGKGRGFRARGPSARLSAAASDTSARRRLSG